MGKIYFAFAISDSMLDATKEYLLKRTPVGVEEIKGLSTVESALNPSHVATIDAMGRRFGIATVAIPQKAVNIRLDKADVLYLMTVRGLPRLEGTRQYTAEEIEKAEFTFSKYEVL